MKAKITKSNGTIIELDDCTAADLVALLGVDWNIGAAVSIPSCWPLVTCLHEYPTPWHGVVPPCCKKCGLQAQSLTGTYP